LIEIAPEKGGNYDRLYFIFGAESIFPHHPVAFAALSGTENLFVDEVRMSAKVTVEEVARVAELAHLELTPDETGSMLTDLNAILDYVAELNQIDTTGVEPLAQVSELGNAVGASAPRVDQLRPSLDRAVVMPEAPDSDQVFFKVPKVIER
jgi:aspartyl-tRNA(Asn)/glutamyl-tRNA(Gln) amidotransferase subunit C